MSTKPRPRIQFYDHPNDPYRQFLRDGMDMTPDELFVSFMKMRASHRAMFGSKRKTTEKLTISKPSWI